MRILINFAHPAKSRSRINKALIAMVDQLEGVTVNDLYANYPDLMIDVKKEQALCESHDIIIFQHPLYWYQTPAIMKEWLDLVLQQGWAYGSTGNALKGKVFVQAITTGGDESTYHREGVNYFSIGELMSPYRATANLCGMIWQSPFMIHGIHKGLPEGDVNAHAESYRRWVISLRDGTSENALSTEEEFPGCCSKNIK